MHRSNPKSLLQNLTMCASSKTETLTKMLARILVCKPHSADCKRLVSAYNTVKTNSRIRLERKTISNKTPAHAFTPPAEKKIGAKWAFMYNCSGREHEKWLFKNI